MGGQQDAVDAAQDRAKARVAATQRFRALVPPPLRSGRHLALDMSEQRLSAIPVPQEHPQRRVESTTVGVGVEVTQARGQAASHLTVRRRVLAAHQPATAMSQRKQRLQLLHELGDPAASPQRTDVDRVPGGGSAGDLQHRERDVQPAADVAQAVVSRVERDVAGRTPLLDQAVLDDERPSSEQVAR